MHGRSQTGFSAQMRTNGPSPPPGRLQARDQNRAASFFSPSKTASDTGTHRSKRPLIFCVNRNGISSPLLHIDMQMRAPWDPPPTPAPHPLRARFRSELSLWDHPQSQLALFYLDCCTRHFLCRPLALLLQDKIRSERYARWQANFSTVTEETHLCFSGQVPSH